MASVNKAIILGHVGKDPEIRYLPNGDAGANFSIATSEKWKDKSTGELVEQTEWHRCNAFGKLAEIIEKWVTKGMLVYVEGAIKTRKWTDKDGVERYTTEIRLDKLQMCGGKSDPEPRREPAREQRPAPSKAASFDDLDDDIPF